VHPKVVTARCEVAHGLLATDAGGCGHDHLRSASTGGGGSRKKGSTSIVFPCASEGSLSSAHGDPRPAGHGSRWWRASITGGGRLQRQKRPEEGRVEGGG
jgi:hypothetical protein